MLEGPPGSRMPPGPWQPPSTTWHLDHRHPTLGPQCHAEECVATMSTADNNKLSDSFLKFAWHNNTCHEQLAGDQRDIAATTTSAKASMPGDAAAPARPNPPTAIQDTVSKEWKKPCRSTVRAEP